LVRNICVRNDRQRSAQMNLHQKQNDPLVVSGRDVTAVLGPTNTGKTHLAIERMVAHESGIIGLPLRLLAREVYTRVCEKIGASKVALVTGEEKIIPPGARYSVCTVEAMPRETDAAFVAIDEIQLAGDLERGHIFTDRILHLRGRQETLLLGAATMRGILEKLLRGISVVTRPRLSHLAYSGSKKITRMPRRSAIVAFSAEEVYAIAELIRRQRGGAAVVLGALSPRTRNAQVELYQNGDVDYLVATDAIGMGLNLDLDHVAFAQNRKFDGFQFRDLSAGELGQIAGRAGRYLRDGTFGVTGQVDPLDDALVARIEAHDFDPVKVLQWRTARFDFASVDALKRSIDTVAPVEGLTRSLPSVDVQALEQMARDPEVMNLAVGRERVAKLWDVCSLPDYRRIAPAQHSELVASIFFDLVRRGHVDENYMADQVKRADSTDGEIDTLSQRIAQIRTWTYVSNRPGWLADQHHWQEKTREIEDRLSDALHERLTKRFVDRRTSVLMRRLRENTMLEAEISANGTVLVEGHHVGELQGFRFTADQSAAGEDGKAIKSASQKALAAEFESRAERFAGCANGDLALGSDGTLRWIGAPIGTLTSSDDLLKPRVILFADEQLNGPARDRVQQRAERFVSFQIETLLKPLFDLRGAEQLTGIARGIAFQLVENFGLLNRRDIADDIKTLDQDGRAALRRLGVRFGAYHIFVPALLKPAPSSIVTLLWALKNDGKDKPGFGDVVHALAAGRTSMVVNTSFDAAFYRLAGYRILGRRAVRVDILERLADLIRPALAWKQGTGTRPEGAFDGSAFLVTPAMMSILGANGEDIEEILKGLGYRHEARPAADVKARLATIDQAIRDAVAKAAADKELADQAKTEAFAAAAKAEAVASAGATETVATEDAVAQPEAVQEAAAVAEVDEPAVAEPEAVATEEAAPEAAETVAADAPAEEQPAALTEAVEAVAVDEPAAEASVQLDAPAQAPVEPAEEPKPILLWRPARFENRQRPSRDNNRSRGPRRDGAEGGNARPQHHRGRRDNKPAEAVAGAAEAGAPAPGRDPGKPRFDRDRYKPKPGEKPAEGRRPNDFGNKRQDGRGDRRPEGRGDRQDGPNRSGEKPSFQARPKPREEAPVRFDPDSPFAKLAALRDQLKK
jgi:ATP-dependent RNA helicase SUPV3L1/SUV3